MDGDNGEGDDVGGGVVVPGAVLGLEGGDGAYLASRAGQRWRRREVGCRE